LQFPVPGNYQIKLIAGAGCGLDTTINTVCSVGAPLANISISSNSGCLPFSPTTSNNSSTLGDCMSGIYIWSVGYAASNCGTSPSYTIANGSLNTASPQFTFNNPGTYTLTLLDSNLCGSSIATISPIIVKASPQISLPSIPNSCTPDTLNMNPTVSNCGSSALTYNWTTSSGGTPNSSTIANPTFYFSSYATHTINVSVGNECGVSQATQSFQIVPPPVANASVSNNVTCANVPVQLSAANTTPGSSFLWSPSASVTNPNSQNTSASPTITTTYYLTVTSPLGCTDTDSVKVNVRPIPNLTPVPDTICRGQNATISVTTGGGNYNYLWSNGATTQSINVSPIANTSYTVTVTIPATGCSTSVAVPVIVNQIPAIVSTPSSQIKCSGSITDSVVWSSSVPSTSYTWNLLSVSNNSLSGYITTPPAQTGNLDAMTIFNPTNSLQYVVYQVTPSANQCNGAPFNDTIFIRPLPRVRAIQDTTICSNNQFNPITLSSIPTGATFNWTASGQSGSVTGYSPTSQSNAATVFTNTNILNSSNVPQTVTYTISPASNGCTGPDSTFIVTVNPAPVVTFTQPSTTFCSGDSTRTIFLNSTTPGVTYSWTASANGPVTGLNTSGSGQNFIPSDIIYNDTTINITVTYSVLASVNNGTGNRNGSSLTCSITIKPLPIINVVANPVAICSGSSSQISITTNLSTATTYSWTTLQTTGSLISGFTTSGNIPPTTNPFSQTLTNSGSSIDSIYYIFTPTSSLCPGPKDTVVIKVIPNPSTTFTIPKDTICSKEITLQNNFISLAGSTFSWTALNPHNLGGVNPTSGTTAFIPPMTLINNSTSIDSVKFNVVSTYLGCPGPTATTTVYVNPLPVVSAGADTTLCSQAIAFPLNLGTPSNGTWSGPNVSGPIGSQVFNSASNGSYDLVYYYKNPLTNCDNTDTLKITVVSPSNAYAGLDTVVCQNSPLVQLTGQPTGGTWSGSPLVTLQGLFTTSTAGNYDLIYTYGTGTCLTRDTMKIIVNPAPNTVLIGDVICFGETAIVSVSGGTGYVWNGGQTNDTIFVSPIVSTFYSVTASNSFSCTRKDSIQVIVNPLPVVKAGRDTTLCNQPIGFSLDADTNYGIPNGGIWSDIGNLISGPIGSQIFTPNGIGIDTLYYTYTNPSTLCQNKDTLIVSVINPSFANAGSDTSICKLSPALQLLGNPVGGTWTGNPYVSGSGLFLPSDTGTFNNIYTIGAGTCLSIDTVLVHVNPLPNVITVSDVICFGDSAIISANGGVSYLWSNGQANSSITINPIITTTYTVTVTNSFGCTKDDSATVLVNPLPIVFAGNDTALCDQPIPVQLVGTPNGGVWSGPGVTSTGLFTPAGVNTYSLVYQFTNSITGCNDRDTVIINVVAPQIAEAGPDTTVCRNAPSIQLTGSPIGGTWSGSTFISSNGLFSTTTAGTYTVYYSYGGGNCFSKDSLKVIVNQLPSITTINDTICFGQNTSIIPTVDLAGGTYTWSPFTSAAPNITVSPTTTTTYQVVYSLFGCNDTAVAEIYVKPVSIPQVANQTICTGENATLTASAGIAGGDYIWSNGQTTTSIIVNPSITTNYSVQYDLDGCLSSSVNSTVTVNPVPTLGVNNATICAGDIATLMAIVNLPGGTFTWGNPPVAGGSSLSITPLSNTSITVNYSLNGCNSLPATSTITVKPLPIATFTSNLTEGCVPLSVTLTADDPTNTDYTWTTSNSLNGTGASSTINFQSSGDFNVSLTTNLNGCIVTQTANNYIQVDNYPIASFSSSVLVFSEQNQFVQFENNSIGAASYSWSFGDGQTSTLENPDHIFLSTDQGTTILLTAISLHGCTDTVSFDIPFDPGLIYYIPNSFTPDGDMFNQTFNPIFSSGADPYNFTMNIYNRWGEVIFETHDISIGWDGSYGMGTKCEPGTYTYEIIMKYPNIDERKRIHGSVNLIR